MAQRRRSRVAGLCMLVGLLGAPGLARATLVQVNPTGAAPEEVTISLFNQETGQEYRAQSGQVYTAEVPPGTYDVVAQGPGLAGVRRGLVVGTAPPAPVYLTVWPVPHQDQTPPGLGRFTVSPFVTVRETALAVDSDRFTVTRTDPSGKVVATSSVDNTGFARDSFGFRLNLAGGGIKGSAGLVRILLGPGTLTAAVEPWIAFYTATYEFNAKTPTQSDVDLNVDLVTLGGQVNLVYQLADYPLWFKLSAGGEAAVSSSGVTRDPAAAPPAGSPPGTTASESRDFDFSSVFGKGTLGYTFPLPANSVGVRAVSPFAGIAVRNTNVEISGTRTVTFPGAIQDNFRFTHKASRTAASGVLGATAQVWKNLFVETEVEFNDCDWAWGLKGSFAFN